MKTNRMNPKKLLAATCLLVAVLGCAAPLVAQDAADAAAIPPKDKTLMDLFNSGGPLMWPLLGCSIGTAAVGIYCFLQIQGKKMMPPAQVEAVGQYMQVRDASSAYSLCHGQPNVFANTMSAALLKVNFERDLANKVSMEQAA